MNHSLEMSPYIPDSELSPDPSEVLAMQEAIEKVGSTRFHDHFEGIFTATDLSTRGNDINDPGLFERIGLHLPQPIINCMHDTMAPAEHKKDLSQFIGRLSTRWLRAGLMWGILHSKETGLTGDQILEEYFAAALEKLYKEGTVNLEMMFAVFNMTLEGDLSNVPTPPERMNPSQEEKDLIQQWNTQVAAWKEAGVAEQHVPTIQSYLKAFKRVVTRDDRFSWEDNENTSVEKKMKVTSIVQIRRDQSTDKILQDDPLSLYPMPGNEGQEVLRNLVNCYYGIDEDGPLLGGFNIAGIEDLPNTELYTFTGFRKVLAYNSIPLNVHAGEIRMQEWIEALKNSFNFQEYEDDPENWIPPVIRRGFNNLYIALMDSNISRIGHANLLVSIPRMKKRFIEMKKIAEACRNSNIWTSVATERVHAIIEEAQAELQFRDLVLPQADDEAIFDTPHPYAQEALYFGKATGLLMNGNYEEVATYLRDRGEQVLVWKKRSSRRPKKVLPYDEIPGTVFPEV